MGEVGGLEEDGRDLACELGLRKADEPGVGTEYDPMPAEPRGVDPRVEPVGLVGTGAVGRPLCLWRLDLERSRGFLSRNWRMAASTIKRSPKR